MKFIFLALVVIVSSVAGLTATKGRIVGAPDVTNKATEGQFPYVVSVTENGRHICGGFIYSQQWIVTAASCVKGKTASTLKVVVGQLSLVDTEVDEKVLSIYGFYVYDTYDEETKHDDIALIKLSTAMTFVPGKVDSIKYSEVDPTLTVNTIAGWGANIDGGYESLSLRFGKVDFVTVTPTETDKCVGYTVNTDFFIATMLCAVPSAAEAPAGSPCQYDEGSPLVQDSTDADGNIVPVAVGIMSKTPACSTSSSSVYTRLSVYYAWFNQLAGPQSV